MTTLPNASRSTSAFATDPPSSGQIGIGALAGVIIGNSPIGLRWTVLVCVLVPLSLVWFCRPLPATDDDVQTAIAAP